VSVGKPERLRLAEITSGLGALVLGVGLGALAGERLRGLGLLLLAGGAVVHAWGMFEKHRIEKQAGAVAAWWEPAAYWACWLLLGLLAIAIAVRLLGLA
jgi:hypothetical protein